MTLPNKLLTSITTIIFLSILLFVGVSFLKARPVLACGWCAGGSQCSASGGSASPDSSCTNGFCCNIPSQPSSGGGGTTSTSGFSCWCTGSSQCSFGGVPGVWGGGDTYCISGLKCCNPAPVTTTTTAPAPINGESCGWCAGNDQCFASTGHAATQIVNSAVCTTGFCCTGYTPPIAATTTTSATGPQTYIVSGRTCIVNGVSVSVCNCQYGYTCSGSGYATNLPPGNLQCTDTSALPKITCTRIPGTASTIYGTAGTACDNPLSRGACGSAGGCSDGQQRLCSNGVLGACVISDACAAQQQTVSSGQSCDGLRRLSVGEASRGAFVGCQGTQNCFCSLSGTTLTGSVICYTDIDNDSCAAPGLNTTTGSTTVASIPTATPTTTIETPPFVCLSMSKDIENPKFGQSVRFTCGTVATATRYEFQYKVGTQSGTIAPLNEGSNVTVPFAITKVGTYKAQCRPCKATECAPWAETF